MRDSSHTRAISRECNRGASRIRETGKMHNTISRAAVWMMAAGTAVLLTACGADSMPASPKLAATSATDSAQLNRSGYGQGRRHEEQVERLVEKLRRVTARYHNIEVAKRDNFVLLHDCETRLNDEPVGT